MRPSALSGLRPVLLPPAPFPPCCPSGGPAVRPASAPSPPAPPDPLRFPAPCHAACVARVSEAHPGSPSRCGTMGRGEDWRADTAADRGGACSPAPDAAFGLSGLRPGITPAPAPFPPCCPSGRPPVPPLSRSSPPAPPDPLRFPAPCHAACSPGKRSAPGVPPLPKGEGVGERIGEPIRRLIAVVAVRRPAPEAAFGLIRATAREYARARALPTVLPVGRPSRPARQRP